MKLLSVTIPSYNSQEYMEKAINSALIGGDDIEILVVDDGSSDNTLDIALKYEKYPGIVPSIKKMADMARLLIRVLQMPPVFTSKF